MYVCFAFYSIYNSTIFIVYVLHINFTIFFPLIVKADDFYPFDYQELIKKKNYFFIFTIKIYSRIYLKYFFFVCLSHALNDIEKTYIYFINIDFISLMQLMPLFWSVWDVSLISWMLRCSFDTIFHRRFRASPLLISMTFLIGCLSISSGLSN